MPLPVTPGKPPHRRGILEPDIAARRQLLPAGPAVSTAVHNIEASRRQGWRLDSR